MCDGCSGAPRMLVEELAGAMLGASNSFEFLLGVSFTIVLLEFEHLDLGTGKSKFPENPHGTTCWGRAFYILTGGRGIVKKAWTWRIVFPSPSEATACRSLALPPEQSTGKQAEHCSQHDSNSDTTHTAEAHTDTCGSGNLTGASTSRDPQESTHQPRSD